MLQSYFSGGFECSTHRNFQNRRLDVIAATRHDIFAEEDYKRLLNAGMKTARDGVRWHLIEKKPYQYDFSSAISQIKAARKTGIQIIWDLFHYGYPDDLDIFSDEFPVRFASFAKAFTEILLGENQQTPFICPVNEISFFGWVSGDVGAFFPFARGRGDEMKRQLVRATILAIDEIRKICPAARFMQADPAIHVTVSPTKPQFKQDAENFRQAQFHALDMLIGKRAPELGGAEKYLDIIGVNFYSQNQWRHPSGRRVMRGHKNYRPFSQILQEWSERYHRPILIAETGIEDDERADWFRYICEETRLAAASGVQVVGICLYPIVNHPGWDDNRHCHNGLWDYANRSGERGIYAPLAEELFRQQTEQELFEVRKPLKANAKTVA